MKKFWQRVGALALVISMVLPMVATAAPTFAAEETSAGKPELFVDFLGDNVAGFVYPGVNTGTAVPSDQDQSYEQSKGPWKKYGPSDCTEGDCTPTQHGTVFWIGVGINNMAQFELAKEKRGLSSVELGFYYNPEFVEPYTGDENSDFKTVLAANNLGTANTKNQWNAGDYEIVFATADAAQDAGEAGRQMADSLTQEHVPAEGWKLAHVSLHKKEGATGENRFATYDEANTSTQYVMMIPFVLLKYDPEDKICFTLTRSASLFSIGGGDEGYTLGIEPNEDSSYGAWERITRNPGHNLKEMFDFTGDLNIFTGKKQPDLPHTATLNIAGNPGSGDSATLHRSRESDPSVPPPQAYVDQAISSDKLEEIYPQTELTLDITCESGTTLKITASPSVTITPVVANEKYTLLMPDSDVTVTVTFEKESPKVKYDATLEIQNSTGEAQNTAILRYDDNTASVDGTSGNETLKEVPVGTKMVVETQCHPDDDVTVEVWAGKDKMEDVTTDESGNIIFSMPPSDVTVKVIYTRAPLYGVLFLLQTLNGGDGSTNQARLSYRDWEWDENDPDSADTWKRTATLQGPNETTSKWDPKELDENIGIRKGREVTVSVKPGLGYVATVTIDRGTGIDTLTLTSTAFGIYPESTTFTMPDVPETKVQVTFTRLPIKLVTAVAFESGSATPAETVPYGEPENYFEISAEDAYGNHNARSNPDTAAGESDSFELMSGKEVTVKLHHGDDYSIENVHIVNGRGDIIPYQGSIINGTLTFVTPGDPGDNVEVRVVYKDTPVTPLKAELVLDDGDSGSANRGWWDDNGTQLSSPTILALEGDKLHAQVEVQSGWYIASVQVIGASGSYPYTPGGNGWSNGASTNVTADIWLDMPNEDVKVYVQLVEGEPGPEPDYTAALQVSDTDNTDGTANNWAQISVNGGTAMPVGNVTKDKDNPYFTPVEQGDVVTVTFEADDGYYVDSVELGPTSEGKVAWKDDHTVTYVQGAVSTCVTVTFKKGDPEPNKATLHWVNAQGDDKAELTNTNPKVTTDNVTNTDGGFVSAFAGDTIEINAKADGSRYISAVYVMEGGTLVPLKTPVDTGNQTRADSFVMQNADIDVYVVFSDTKPDPDEHTVILTVTDLSASSSTPVGTAGSATMTESGGNTSVKVESEGTSGTLVARKGNTVALTIEPRSNYSIDSVILSQGGVATLNWQDPYHVSFTMPDEDVGVEVRLKKGDPTKYSADIVLHGPAGVLPLTAGDAWFDGTVRGTYFTTAVPGQGLTVNIAANPGYRIKEVTVTPEGLGVGPVAMSGIYGQQTASFVMPAGNVIVNVYFEEGWPDDSLTATLKVIGPTGSGEAELVAPRESADSSTGLVQAGPSTTADPSNEGTAMAWDDNLVYVQFKEPAEGYKVSIEVTDQNGDPVDWAYNAKYNDIGKKGFSFTMPDMDVLVTVTYSEGIPDLHKAYLDWTGNGTGSISVTTTATTTKTSTSEKDTYVEGYGGDTISVTAVPDPGYRFVGVVVTENENGGDIPTGTLSDNHVDVLMQEQDITIQLIFAEEGKYAATLQLEGPDDAGAGTITDTVTANTATVNTCPGVGVITVDAGGKVTVTGVPQPGYVVDTIRIYSIADGIEIMPTGNRGSAVDFVMPEQDVKVIVTFQPLHGDVTVQVIVDDAGESGNIATLYRDSETSADGVPLLVAKPSEPLHLHIHPEAGYEVELVMVTPDKYKSIFTTLTLPYRTDTELDFYMPAADIEIFVRFVPDTKLRHNITLDVTHDTANGTLIDFDNKAKIYSDYTGWQGPINDPEEPVTVQAANVELVTIEVEPKSGYTYDIILTKNDGSNTPVTDVHPVLTKGDASTATQTYQFPAPDYDVLATVVFKKDPSKYLVYLHITGAGAGDAAIITSTYDPNQTTNVDMGHIEAPVLDVIKLNVTAGDGHYIKDAYVQYEKAVLDCEPNNERKLETNFLMQQGTVHVYVVFAEGEPPEIPAYAATLTVTDLTDPDQVGWAGSAVMTSGTATTEAILSNETETITDPADPTNSVVVPKHGLLTVTQGETVVVTITLEPDYEIDSIITTPLGLDASQVVTPAQDPDDPNKYTFTMPAHNVGVEVRLKKGSGEGIYNATLHYIMPTDGTDSLNDGVPASGNLSTLTYGNRSIQKDMEQLRVPVGGDVTAKVDVQADWYIKKAYIIQKATTKDGVTSDPAMIAFEPEALEGKKGAVSITNAKFVMPETDVDVYFEFAKGEPPVDEYTAAFMMTDPTGGTTAGNSGIMSRSGGTDTLSIIANDGHKAFNAKIGETMTFELTIADGYEVDYITVTPVNDGAPIVPDQDPTDANKYTFTMPDYDVLVYVKVKMAELPTYKVTLEIDDRSSAIGNTASITVTPGDGSAPVTDSGDGAVIDNLAGGEQIRVDAVLQSDVKVAVAIASYEKSGNSETLSGTNSFDTIMPQEDMTITLVLVNKDDPNYPYTATLKKVDTDSRPGNTAVLSNETDAAQPHGNTWTMANEKDSIRVDFVVEPDYTATVTAVEKTSGVAVPVYQSSQTGTGYALIDMPRDDLEITITYAPGEPDPTAEVTLKVVGTTESGNFAELKTATTSPAVRADGTDPSKTLSARTPGEVLTLTTGHIPGWHVDSVVVTSNGVSNRLTLTDGEASFTVPVGASEVVVTFAEGERTFRPYDPKNETPKAPGTQEGHLIADNLGSNRVEIDVPTLFSKADGFKNATDVKYTLYLKDAAGFHKLEEGVDYDVVSAITPYSPSHNDGKDYTGVKFTIRGLQGESTLNECMLNGGMIYITATGTDENDVPLVESEHTQVVIPADPNKGKYTATLRIVDTSGVSGNKAELGDSIRVVTNDGNQLTNLAGNERLRAVATPASDKVRVVVTATDSTGMQLLTETPEDSERYLYDMIREDVIITVYFMPDGPDGPFIATVDQRGATAVAGNSAAIKNDTRNDLVKGALWAAGYKDNVMRVTVDVADGYYATVTAFNKKDGSAITVTSFGMGPGVTQFDAILTMPAADVQVYVTYTTDPQPDLENDLVLTLVDAAPESGNMASLTKTGETAAMLAVKGDDANQSVTSADKVAAGTKFTLATDHTSNHYVDKIEVLVYADDSRTTVTSTLTLALDNAGESAFVMPLGATEVKVYFKNNEQEPRTPRPYDPDHSKDYNSSYIPGGDGDLSSPTQAGWILAMPLEDDATTSQSKVQVLVPALHDDESTDPNVWQALSDARINEGAVTRTYHFYWRDSYGIYHELVEGTDIAIEGEEAPKKWTISATEEREIVGYDMTLTVLKQNSILDYYIKNGGTIYATVTKNPAGTEKESDYTQVVIPKLYTATLYYEPNGDTATMAVGDKSVTGNGDVIKNLMGKETVVVSGIKPDNGYEVVGVVATTESGSVNVPEMASGTYEYTMVEQDVELQVVYRKKNDPLVKKGPRIVTVYKQGDDGLLGNDATVTDLDVVIPPEQKGDIWTAAYDGNVIRVDITTEPGYYVDLDLDENGKRGVVAEQTDGTEIKADIEVIPFGSYVLFYMPDPNVNGYNVDVTVTYKKGTPKPHVLTLTTQGTEGKAGNSATLTPDGMAGVKISGEDTSRRVPDDSTLVKQETALTLTTSTESGYSVKSAKLVISGVSIDIPLTDGVSLPLPTMPAVDAEVIVTFQQGTQTARPYDPEHSEHYNTPDYQHNTDADLSQTHQEGWILAETTGSDSFRITVPTLHNKADGADTLYDAAYEGEDAAQPEYKLYWKDSMGVFQPLTVGTDIQISNETVLLPADNDGTHYGYQFDVQVMENDSGVPTLWGGYKLEDYLANGSSIWITATGIETGTVESEKTEVVITPEESNYTATLHIVDHSSALGNVAEMSHGTTVKHDDGDKITSLKVGDTIITTVDPQTGVTVRSVLATDSTGTHVLTLDGEEYHYQISKDGGDVDITVVFDNYDPDDPDVPEMYLAIVEKTGAGAAVDGNTATVSNTRNPALPKGDIWTGIYGERPEQRLQVDVKTVAGWEAHITAKTKDNAGNDITLSVLQLGTEGDVVGYLNVPSDLYANVTITVEYVETGFSDLESPLELQLVGHDNNNNNWASITDGASLTLNAYGKAPQASASAVIAGIELVLSTGADTGYYVEKVELSTGDVTVDLPLNNGGAGFTMPASATVVTVTYAQGVRTPRPHDYDQHPSGNDYIDGYLLGENKGNNQAVIRVPNLYYGQDAEPEAVAAADSTVKDITAYTLYFKAGGTYIKLRSGVDYDVASGPDAFETSSANKAKVTGDGLAFQIRSLKGESALTELLVNGGLLYITATQTMEDGTKYAESEYVEVVLDADPQRGKHTATLHVVDNSGVRGNVATMNIDTHSDVNYISDGNLVDSTIGTRTDLTGDELVRTLVQAADGARISAVTVTDSAGTRLLEQMPTGMDPKRFPYYMTDEDIVITVYFEADSEDTRYIAAVAKHGATAVSGNDADVIDITDSALLKGAIWAEGRETDTMQVTVTVADGYYAAITAKQMSGGKRVDLLDESGAPVSKLGPGGSYTLTLTMPADDVQIDVTFTRELNDDLQPFDPDNVNSDIYEDNWISSENQGDRLIVTVPMLNKKDGTDATDVDKEKHTFHFYMAVDDGEAESLDDVISLTHPDPDNTTDPYENDVYYTDGGSSYTGARFILTVKSDDAIEADTNIADQTKAKELAALLRAVMDNAGSETAIIDGVQVGDEEKKVRLYITHTEEDTDFESELVDFEVPKYTSLTGEFTSYAPAHITTLSLYAMNNDGEYEAPSYDFQSDMPYHMELKISEPVGNGLWQQSFTFKSSKLEGKMYQLVIKKAAHITYTRPMIALDTELATEMGCYDSTTRTFSFENTIDLICGDIDGTLTVKFPDWDYLIMFMYKTVQWTRAENDTDSDAWALSVFNPESMAYACDLNGDGNINILDENILMEERNYNRSVKDYGNPSGLSDSLAVAMFSLRRAPQRNVMQEAEEREIPGWVAERVQMGIQVPLWAVELLREETEIPAWAIELLRNGAEIPAWAVELIQTGEELPDWAKELLAVGEILPEEPMEAALPEEWLPDWAKELIAAGENIPDWAMRLLEEGKEVPVWAMELIQTGIELPEWALIILEEGGELPAEPIETDVVTPPAEQETPVEPDLTESENPDAPTDPAESENPDVPVDPTEPEGPDIPVDPEEPATPEIPVDPTEPPVTPDVPADPEESSAPDVPVDPTEPTAPDITVDFEKPTLPADSAEGIDSETPANPVDPTDEADSDFMKPDEVEESAEIQEEVELSLETETIEEQLPLADEAEMENVLEEVSLENTLMDAEPVQCQALEACV